jgi:hypothetical protein
MLAHWMFISGFSNAQLIKYERGYGFSRRNKNFL